MLQFIMSYAKDMVRPDDPSADVGLLCFQACSSILLVHPKGGRAGDARVVTSYTSVVLGYAGSFKYGCSLRCDWGRWQVVIALSVRRNSYVAISALPNVRVRCSKDVMGWMFSGAGHSPQYPIFLAPAALTMC